MQSHIHGSQLVLLLLSLLKELRHKSQALVDLLAHERKTIARLAVDELASVNEAKLQMLKDIGSCEEKRMNLIVQLAEAWQVPADAITLAQISERVGGQIEKQLQQEQMQLNHVIRAARESNQVTGALLRKSLAFLYEAAAIMQTPYDVPLSLYSGSGSLQSSAMKCGLLERRG